MSDTRTLPGLVATVCLSGSVTPQWAAAMSEMRSWNDRNGYHKVEYQTYHAVLVESGRDSVVEHMLKERYEWVLQVDADAGPFPADALARMLEIAFVQMPHMDALGAYCQLKGGPNLPTIDTGSGTWEEHYPGEGVVPVIRTGAHFLLCKRNAFRNTGPPWFRTRIAQSPFRAFMEVDGFARRTLQGDNPMEKLPEWDTLMHSARTQSYREQHVGEDSGFFDKLRATGGTAYVDTDLVVGHVAQRTITPDDFIKAMRRQWEVQAACLGLR